MSENKEDGVEIPDSEAQRKRRPRPFLNWLRSFFSLEEREERQDVRKERRKERQEKLKAARQAFFKAVMKFGGVVAVIFGSLAYLYFEKDVRKWVIPILLIVASLVAFFLFL